MGKDLIHYLLWVGSTGKELQGKRHRGTEISPEQVTQKRHNKQQSTSDLC